jgi:hypothetical protein
MNIITTMRICFILKLFNRLFYKQLFQQLFRHIVLNSCWPTLGKQAAAYAKNSDLFLYVVRVGGMAGAIGGMFIATATSYLL